MKKTNFLMLSAFVAAIFLLMSFVLPQEQKQPEPWEVPSKYQKKTNPYADDASLIKVGKMLYSKHCKSCHGNTGECDGPKAKQLETYCSDFTSAEFQAQSAGEMYYKSFIGRNEMPNFEKKVTDEEDRWAIINYMVSLKK